MTRLGADALAESIKPVITMRFAIPEGWSEYRVLGTDNQYHPSTGRSVTCALRRAVIRLSLEREPSASVRLLRDVCQQFGLRPSIGQVHADAKDVQSRRNLPTEHSGSGQ